MTPKVRHRTRALSALWFALVLAGCESREPAEQRRAPSLGRDAVEALVHDHARAWMTGDTALVRGILHEEARLAYPRRRVDRETWIHELAAFHRQNVDTRIYVHRVVVDGDTFAVEWQFATTDRQSGERTAVGDAIIGEVRDGRIVLWKEYLDGRVFALQRAGELPLDEGEEPFPWPRVPTPVP